MGEQAETLPTMLRRLRSEHSLTQRELAEAAGISPGALAMLERGMRTKPTPDVLIGLADALGVTVDALARASVVKAGRETSG